MFVWRYTYNKLLNRFNQCLDKNRELIRENESLNLRNLFLENEVAHYKNAIVGQSRIKPETKKITPKWPKYNNQLKNEKAVSKRTVTTTPAPSTDSTYIPIIIETPRETPRQEPVQTAVAEKRASKSVEVEQKEEFVTGGSFGSEKPEFVTGGRMEDPEPARSSYSSSSQDDKSYEKSSSSSYESSSSSSYDSSSSSSYSSSSDSGSSSY